MHTNHRSVWRSIYVIRENSARESTTQTLLLHELRQPGDYLSQISCYYQVLVQVPRPIAARGIRLGLRVRYGYEYGTATARTPIDA